MIKIPRLIYSILKTDCMKLNIHCLKPFVWICMDGFYRIYLAIVQTDSLQPAENVYLSY